jgi:type I restriction enzyme S subunit
MTGSGIHAPDSMVGRVARYTGEDDCFLINQRVGRFIIHNPNEIDSRYLFFILTQPEYQWELVSIATGSANQVNISAKQIESLKIPVPPLSEQKAIAHILSSLDDKIELNRQMNETLEAMARAIFKSWFVDFDPVSTKRSGRQPAGMDTATADLFPDEFEESSLGLIPKGWKIKALPDVIDFLEGPGIRNWQYTNSDEGTKFINIRCIKNRDLILDTANRIHDKEAYGKYQHFLLKPKDIVVSTSGTLGRFAIVREEHLPLMLNTSVIRMRPIYNVCNWEFLLGYIESEIFQQELNARACGSVQKNFGPMHLKQMFIVVPPIEILNSHTLIIGNLIQRSLDNLSEISTLATIRDTLLPKLMSGEIRVKEAEKIMEKLS